jgi:hypothetical protein
VIGIRRKEDIVIPFESLRGLYACNLMKHKHLRLRSDGPASSRLIAPLEYLREYIILTSLGVSGPPTFTTVYSVFAMDSLSIDGRLICKNPPFPEGSEAGLPVGVAAAPV